MCVDIQIHSEKEYKICLSFFGRFEILILTSLCSALEKNVTLDIRNPSSEVMWHRPLML